ncbi:MAG: leucine-rich repeat protein [Prolixibacteraceae bacterium]|nr:leucine-rich repeat protein [Prolixibacteraceae bacterium]
MQYIGKGAFNVCSSMTSVTLPDGIDSIKKDCFSFCRSLKSVIIPYCRPDGAKKEFRRNDSMVENRSDPPHAGRDSQCW